MATDTQILQRLRTVTNNPNRDMASLVQQSIERETSKDREIKKPRQCIVCACSTPAEERDRWEFMRHSAEGEKIAERSIQAARNVVDRYLKQLGIEHPDWSQIN